MEPPEVGRERHRDVAALVWLRLRHDARFGSRVGIGEVFQLNRCELASGGRFGARRRRRRAHLRHDIALGWRGVGLELRRHLHRLAMEEHERLGRRFRREPNPAPTFGIAH